MAPNLIGKNIILDLDKTSSVSITAADLDNYSTDNCNFSLSINQDTFTTAGDYNVILTGTDSSNNISNISVIVTITNIEKNGYQLDLYPVPTKNFVRISTELKIDVLEIFDVSGRLIKKIVKPKKIVNMIAFKTGFYLFVFKTEKGIFTKKIINQ
jgi:extracellular elastinolytic metalloproteinase